MLEYQLVQSIRALTLHNKLGTVVVTEELIERLLLEEESSSLDFKEEQYRFAGATDQDKSELLKDILAFANAFRRSDAYILTGVRDVKGGQAEVVGVADDLDDAHLQQFISSKTNRPIEFSYQAFGFKGVKIGVFHVPLQDRPIYAKTEYGKVKKDLVYIRRGSSTAIATPDDIAKMGKLASTAVVPAYTPDVGLRFAGNASRLVLQIDSFKPLSEEILEQSVREYMVDYQRVYPKATYISPDSIKPRAIDPNYPNSGALDYISSYVAKELARMGPSEKEVADYNGYIERRYRLYEDYLYKKMAFEDQRRRIVRLDIDVVNSGTAPAHDIDVWLHFPDGFELIESLNLLREPKEPSAPKPISHYSRFDDMLEVSEFPLLTLNMPIAEQQTSNVSRPSIRRTNSFEVEFSIAKIKHGMSAQLEALVLLYEDPASIKPFVIDFRLHVENLPNQVAGSLEVDVSVA